MNINRLPRLVRLGRGYRVGVALATQEVLREVSGEDDRDLSGYFDSNVAEAPRKRAGAIYVRDRLSIRKKRETYWSGLQHAVIDIADWDRDHPGVGVRLPQGVNLGLGFWFKVELALLSKIKDFLEEDEGEYFGACDSDLGGAPKSPAGVIYILRTSPASKRWETYWHEIKHALADIAAWDREHPVVT